MTYSVIDIRSGHLIIGGYRGSYGYMMCRQYVQEHADQFLTVVGRADGTSEYVYVGE